MRKVELNDCSHRTTAGTIVEIKMTGSLWVTRSISLLLSAFMPDDLP